MEFSIPPPFPSMSPQQQTSDSDDHPMGQSTNEQQMAEQRSQAKSKELQSSGGLSASHDDGGRKNDAAADEELKSLDGLSEISDNLPDSEKVALALSCRDEGNRKLKEGDVEGAAQMYEDGVAKMKNLQGVEPELQKSTKEAKLALNLNLSLCRIKQQEWSKAIRAATSALEVDADNVKGLFRRGVARSAVGFLEEAKADLLRACKLDPSNGEARKELATAKQRAEEAKSRDMKAFKGLFVKSAGMYDDREKQMKEERIKQEEKLKQEMKEFEVENKSREAIGKQPIESFEEWKKEKLEQERIKREAEKKSARPVGCSSGRKATPTQDAEFLDEEDKKILDETKKMGYCYFNRKIGEEEKALLLRDSNKPTKLEPDAVISEPQSPQKALSSWNSKGTTYEEKDCSTWAHAALAERLKSITIQTPAANTSPLDGRPVFEHQLEQTIKAASCPIEAMSKLAVEMIPSKLFISSVSPIEGDAQVIVVRGSKRYLYDFKVEINWTLEVSKNPLDPLPFSNGDNAASSLSPPSDDPRSPSLQSTTYTGSMTFHDLSSASSTRPTTDDANNNGLPPLVDWLESAKIKIEPPQPSEKLHEMALSSALEVLKTEVYNSVKLFENDFKSFT